MKSIMIDGTEYRFFDHLFAVSSCGKVLRKLEPFTPNLRKDGYLFVGRRGLLHRIVAECWLDGFDPKKHIHHINHNKTDNRVENLQCLTASEHLSGQHGEDLARTAKYVRTDETREKIRQSRLGKVTSEETKAKQRAALIGRKRPYFARAKHSEESKQRRSQEHHRNTSCSIAGVEYRSFAAAAEATGIHRFTIRKRCLSENFPDYKIII